MHRMKNVFVSMYIFISIWAILMKKGFKFMFIFFWILYNLYEEEEIIHLEQLEMVDISMYLSMCKQGLVSVCVWEIGIEGDERHKEKMHEKG